MLCKSFLNPFSLLLLALVLLSLVVDVFFAEEGGYATGVSCAR